MTEHTSGDAEASPDEDVEIIVEDKGIAPLAFTDWFLSVGHFAGVVNVDLGTIDRAMTEENKIKVAVSARLRMSLPFAENLHRALADTLAKAAQEGKSDEASTDDV